jgi:large subunit ribosomal protein L6
MTTRFEILQRTVSIPEQVSVQVEGRTVRVKGPLGSLQEDLSHLPVSINVTDNKVRFETTWPRKRENFTGEKTPRYAKIVEGVKVDVRGEDISVEGIDLKSVSQTAANIQDSTKIKKKDLRVFLDGIYVSGKGPAQTSTKPTK